VDHPSFHRPGNPYGDKHGTFKDNQVNLTSSVDASLAFYFHP
jgi:hypothetical protein